MHPATEVLSVVNEATMQCCYCFSSASPDDTVPLLLLVFVQPNPDSFSQQRKLFDQTGASNLLLECSQLTVVQD